MNKNTMMGLTINNLTKSYDGRRILDGLSLAVSQNEIVTIIGKSGSGKTTILLCVLGFIVPDSGNIMVDGIDIGAVPIEKRALAYMPQDYGLFPHLDVAGNIAFGLSVRNIGEETKQKKIEELLKAVELSSEFAHRNVAKLSGGEKQRVALARSLAINPKLFLIDEPLSAIDFETKKEVGRSLRKLIKKLSVPAILITHNPDEAKELGDITYRLENGKLTKV